MLCLADDSANYDWQHMWIVRTTDARTSSRKNNHVPFCRYVVLQAIASADLNDVWQVGRDAFYPAEYPCTISTEPAVYAADIEGSFRPDLAVCEVKTRWEASWALWQMSLVLNLLLVIHDSDHTPQSRHQTSELPSEVLCNRFLFQQTDMMAIQLPFSHV